MSRRKEARESRSVSAVKFNATAGGEEDGVVVSAERSIVSGMESPHHRHLRYYQGRNLGYYNQYQPSFKDSSSWSLWRDYPPPPVNPQRRRRWCNVLLAAAVFLIILAVMVIAGLAIYMGALKLEVSQYLVLDGSFRVVTGDSYNQSLTDHSTDLFQRKSQVYKLMIESIFRRSDLSPAIKQSSVLGFTNGSLIVFFRLILDRRKIPKKAINIEERVKIILLQGVSVASPIKNIIIDKTQVFIKHLGEDSSHVTPVEVENKNQTIEIHNGLLRKTYPRTVTSHYTSTPSNRAQLPKTTTTSDGIIEGSFRLTSSESSTKDQITNFSPYSLYTNTQTPTSSHEYQSSKASDGELKKSSRVDNASSIDFYQHSPALNALLLQKPRVNNLTNFKATTDSTEPVLNYADTDLITLLPYVFQGQEEPWKPILPENFTRYPERRPFATEDYSSEGVGVVEVVLDPEDLTSSVPSKGWPKVGVKNQEYLNLKNPVQLSSSSQPDSSKNVKETFGPRSDDKISFLLNTESEKNEGELEHYDRVHGDILTRYKNNNMKGNSSSLSDILPDFPILQQFHNLDTLLRSYSSKKSHSGYKVSDIPVTLLPARSNLDIKKQIRPRPSKIPGRGILNSGSSKGSETTQPNIKTVKNSIKLKIASSEEENNENSPKKEDNHGITPDVSKSIEDETTVMSEKSVLNILTLSPLEFPKKDLVLEQDHDTSVEILDSETTTQPVIHSLDGNSESRGENMEATSSSNGHYFSEDIDIDGELFVITTMPETLPPMTISSRNHRQSKMSNTFQTEELPLKFDLQDNNNKLSAFLSDKGLVSKSSNNDSEAANQSLIVVKLKDTKMQEILEKIIYNITTETSGTIFSPSEYLSSTYFPFYKHNSSDDDDVNIAHNRKYGQSSAESKNNLIKNSTFFDMKPDMILYYLKHSKNGSSANSQSPGYSNSYLNNENKNSINKSSPNYILNKDGFLMLTKVYNKVNSNAQTIGDTSVKSNFTGNHSTDCSGSMSIKCGSGECINSLSRCNHLVDCADGSDEKNCTCAEFLRAQYLTRKICDGVVDCWDFSDENTCDWCTIGQYVCSNSRVCIDRIQVCDGQTDCPNGDDEKNCVSIAPNISQADSMNYHNAGILSDRIPVSTKDDFVSLFIKDGEYAGPNELFCARILMIRKEGRWGKLCTQNFESLSSIFKSRWTIEDLGKVVCKTMTFRSFESIEHINETSENELGSNTFYELLYSKEAAEHSRLGLTFGNTNCSEKKVVRITCSNLECGLRPQANLQWGRSKRLIGSRHSRIVGGGNAGPGSWPWLAALYKEGEFQCGATLISDRWLLSAGHCFYHALDEYWVARLGALRRGTNLPSPYEQLRVVSRILLHPNYVDSGFINDISLLQMEKPVSLTNYVRPICLPQPSSVLRDGKMCTVIGWGQLFEVGRIFPDTLQEVQLPVISTAECRKRTLFLPLYKVTENMFCAGYDRGGRDACLGDSGGPLMCQENDGHWSLMGVTSNGYGCARANRPGVYTKVANYVSWVHSSMANDSRGELRRRNVTCHGHRCPLGECLPPARICNGFMECSDGSDEKDCW